METLLQDLRYALRALSRAPGFAVVAVLTLGLGIGANTAIFSVVDQLLLRPPPHIVDPDRVVRLYYSTPAPGAGTTTQSTMSYPDFVDFGEQIRGFSSVAAFTEETMSLGQGAQAQPVFSIGASHAFFPLLGVRPALGRFFSADEDRPAEAATVAVLGYEFWCRQFDADPDVLGREILLDGEPFTVIGIAPERFTGVNLKPVDVWRPLATRRTPIPGLNLFEERRASWVHVVGRLQPGTTAAQAEAEATAVLRQGNVDRQSMANATVVAGSVLLARGPSAPQEAQVSLWLAGVAAIVLLIACANAANLLLIRGMHRQREIAVRLALGVSRGRLGRQLITEALVLAVLGGVVGLAFAAWGATAIRLLLLPELPPGFSVLDARILGFTALATLLTGLVAGLVPALQASRPSLTAALRTSTRDGLPQRSTLKSALQVGQVALALVLLAGAGLFIRSLQSAHSVDLGMDADRVLFAEMNLQTAGYSATEIDQLYRVMLERVQELPGVERASVAMMIPFQTLWRPDITIPGRDSIPASTTPAMNAVTPDFFATLGIPLLRGRGPSVADHADSAPVAVINTTMARLFWPDEDPLGRCFHIDENGGACTEIVGVAVTAHLSTLGEEPEAQYYIPLAQLTEPLTFRALLVRTRGEPAQMIGTVRQAMQGAAPNLPFATVAEFRDALEPQLRPWRLGAHLFGTFGAVALLLAVVGLYGVLSYTVAQRRHEIGVRVALGAATRDITRMVIRDSLRMVVLGIVLGGVAALVASRALAALLFGVSANDPTTFTVAAGLLIAAALLASYLPARRAARVDPLVALRSE